MPKPHKSWNFTLNNYSVAEVEMVSKWAAECQRALVSKEVGDSGTPHLQGAFTFKTAKRLAALKKLCPRAHWEPMRVEDSSFLYVLKTDSELVVEVDNRKRKGKRTDLDRVAELVDSGANLLEIVDEAPVAYIKYNKGIRELMTVKRRRVKAAYTLEDFVKPPYLFTDKIAVIMWGPTGMGKTEFALAHFENPLLVSHMDDLQRFVYGLNDGIVFDDMSFNHLPRTSQIHLLDRRERSIHCRFYNGVIPANTPRIFTTNEPDGYIMDIDDPAIRRRVDVLPVGDRLYPAALEEEDAAAVLVELGDRRAPVIDLSFLDDDDSE